MYQNTIYQQPAASQVVVVNAPRPMAPGKALAPPVHPPCPPLPGCTPHTQVATPPPPPPHRSCPSRPTRWRAPTTELLDFRRLVSGRSHCIHTNTVHVLYLHKFKQILVSARSLPTQLALLFSSFANIHENIYSQTQSTSMDASTTQTQANHKWVYYFGEGDTSSTGKALLGGKGAGLGEMTKSKAFAYTFLLIGFDT